ncbi:nitrile hydratase subunit alpha [Mycobacterium sp. M23085]|uniref:nitrile hydratase subunit alpha n=1 Tax=Mycobacterium sp. M23085 TaxID=3378087 RepID=UPI003877DA12
MTTPSERAAQLDLVARLQSSYPELPDAPTPDLIDHERFNAYVKTPHDVGGEPDAPIEFENKQYEIWEHNTYVMCEVLGWRGIWLSEERRRMGNVDVGRTIYLGLPYYARWLLAVARVLAEKHHAFGSTSPSCGMATPGPATTHCRPKSRNAGSLRPNILPEEVEIRVEDSNQKHRFMVMPVRPDGTQGWTEDQLVEIITRDCLIGVALPKPGVTTNVVTQTRPAVHPA